MLGQEILESAERAVTESSSFVRGSFLVLLLIGLVALAGGGFLLSRGDQIAAQRQSEAPAPRPLPHNYAAVRPKTEAPMNMARKTAAPKEAAPPVSAAAGNDGEGPLTTGGADPAAGIDRGGEMVARLRSASAVLDAPKAMMVGQTRPVELRVGVGVPAGALTMPGEPGNQQIPGQTKVSSNMKATLDGAGFAIRASTPEQLPIAEGNVTFWRWDIQAQEAGQHDLKATLYALVEDGGQTLSYQVRTYDQIVVVNVKAKTISDWLDEIAQDADKIKGIVLTLGGLAMTVGGWLGFSRARKTGETPNPS
jgi:hypothetical protein